MAKVTSKLQVTIPKVVADRFGIRPGDSIEWVAAGDSIRVIPTPSTPADAEEVRRARLALFDAATARQRDRQSAEAPAPEGVAERGWRRAELYARGRPG